MKIGDRIEAFEKLGKYVSAIDEVALRDLASRAGNENPWFTESSVKSALKAISACLTSDQLEKWVTRYSLTPVQQKRVAVIMAGNIPLVGFHDFLCVLLSGHSVIVKLSSKDTVLLSHLAEKLTAIEPRFSERIVFAEQIKNFDAVIATGSDNSARYFHYYFGKYPNIIRKNRTSCAVLSGDESADDLNALGADVFTYFGLGCRNVSKVFIPRGYNPALLLEGWSAYADIMNHHKYHNNYDYQKSIRLINSTPFLDSGFVMLQESDRLVSPISVVYYQTYSSKGDLALKLTADRDKIQCIVGNLTPASVRFGHAQLPALWDYADQVDTLAFLQSLN